jgi:hypothetical protein
MNDIPANVSVAANIWADISRENPGKYAALEFIPGDLRVNLIGNRDTRSLEKILTKKQYQEFLYCRFFAPYGQEGATYEDR